MSVRLARTPHRFQVVRGTRHAVLAGITAFSLFTAVPGVVPHAFADSAGLPMRDGMPTLAPIVDKVTPAVVNIAVKSKADTPDMSGIPRDFRRFFQMPDDDEDQPNQKKPQERTQSALGSGIIIDAKKGYILTNHHVIDKATEVIVTLQDRRELTAKVVGSDEGTDIALLQVPAGDLTSLPIGDSTGLKVGDFVLAVGDPFGVGKTVTYGIVSAVGRSSLNIEGFEDFIQTDAAINPGNSGGPLVNLKGELVGMNTAILGSGNVGIGFAIPSAMISSVVDQIIQYGSVKRGLIGVVISAMTPELAKNLGVDVSEGAYVRQVNKGSPAEAAGIKAGDVVTALNGKPLHSETDLRNRLGLMTVGTTVELAINRNGSKMNVKVTIGKTPKEAETKIADREELEGASFDNMEPGAKVHGVRVTDVERGSAAWQLGLKPKDIIVAVNRQPVADFDQLTDALKASTHSTVLAVRRGDEDVRIVLP